jgi:hypothetical protein
VLCASKSVGEAMLINKKAAAVRSLWRSTAHQMSTFETAN